MAHLYCLKSSQGLTDLNTPVDIQKQDQRLDTVMLKKNFQ